MKTKQKKNAKNSSRRRLHPYKVGANYFIRAVTNHYTGKLVAVFPQELELEGTCWIADDGRFANALKTGDFSEVEPFASAQVVIGRGAIIDACVLMTSLPASQK